PTRPPAPPPPRPPHHHPRSPRRPRRPRPPRPLLPRQHCGMSIYPWACRSPCRTERPGRSPGRSRGRRSLAEVLHSAQKLWPANQFGKLTGRKGRCYLARPVRSVGVLLVSVVTGCAVPRSGTAPVSGGALPSPTPPARESLHIAVVYPAVTDVIQSHDSAFLFGAVPGARRPVRLGINGQAVPVFANGASIAWLPLPDDTVAHFLVAATAGPDSSRFVYTARIAPQFRPPSGRAVWI